MKKLIFLLLTYTAFAQFSFVRTDTTDVTAHWLFDTGANPNNINVPLNGSLNLAYTTFGGAYANLTDDLVSGSPIHSGGYGLDFNGTSENLAIADASTGGALDPGTGDFTVSVWIKTTADVTDLFIAEKRSNYTGVGYAIYTSAAGVIRAILTTSGGFAQANGITLQANTNYLITASFDRSANVTLWVNAETAATAAISAYSAQNVDNANGFTLGSLSFATVLYSPVIIYSVKYLDVAVAENWHKDEYDLANVFTSYQHNSLRSSLTNFDQGFNQDTLAVPANIAAGNRGVSITAYGSATDTLIVATSLETKVLALTTSAKTFQFNMEFAANDSLKFIDSSVADNIFFRFYNISNNINTSRSRTNLSGYGEY